MPKRRFRITDPNLSPFKNTRFEEASLSKLDLDEEQAEQISQWLYDPTNFCYIYSSPGYGKTYLCAAVVNHFYERDIPAYYINEEKLFSDLRGLMKDNNVEWRMETIKDAFFLILDDVGSSRSDNEDQRMTIWQKDILFQIIDYRYSKNLATLIISNYSPQDLTSVFHERMVSRLTASENLIIKIKGFDRRKEGA